MADASARGWGSGWPKDRYRDMTRATAGDVTVLVHREIAPVVEWLMAETIRRGYPLHPGQCWGYANRAIRGTNQPSNHSWGLAVDLNAPSNPLADRLITDMPPWMPALWGAWGFRWGGSYRGRKDAMHYEFMGSPDTARELVARLRDDREHALAPTATPARASLPPPTITDFPEEEPVRRYDVTIPLDERGRGWSWVDVPYSQVVSLVAHGPYPPADGYWEGPVLSRQDREGRTVVTATEGQAGATVTVSVWTLGP